MEVVSYVVNTKMFDGKQINIMKHILKYDEPRNVLCDTQKEFTREQKKMAKIKHKLYLAEN